ncbi:MAG: large-conductance mechanosensitive channel protein MscL [Bacteroidales bacterium]
MSFIKEFKTFAVKGNMMDMAVGIIIGAAFGKIITSLVNDIIMPPLGALLGGVNFTDLKIPIKGEYTNEAGELIAAVTLNYGNFIQTAVDFLIIAFAIFMVIKWMNRLKKKEEAAPAPPAEPPVQEKLLEEIRDLLKSRE